MSANRVLHLDFETYNTVDLKAVGLDNYIRTCSLIALAWAFDDGPVRSISYPMTGTLPPDIRAHIEAGGEIRAHNAAFEFAVLADFHCVSVAHEQMVCTMQKALAYGLPAGLLKAGQALGLKILKDESKRRLMLQMSRPRPRSPQPWHETDPGKLAELEAYCRDDVLAERALDKAVPDLHPHERRLSLLDHAINRKGVKIDLIAVANLVKVVSHELNKINAEAALISNGYVTSPGTQAMRLVAWFQNQGVHIGDVSKAAVAKALAGPHGSPVGRRMLELRALAARSSTAKLVSMQLVSAGDGRARNLLQFYGAGRTGRWAGRMIQPQNLPRTGGIKAEQVIAAAAESPDSVGLLWRSPMEAVARSLRSCFIAKPGHVLVSVDLSQIEARVLAWLAWQKNVVEAFAKGEDVYTLVAKSVGSNDRQLGKVLVLACGYGMGPGRFQETAESYGVKLTASEAEHFVRAWRAANQAVVHYWYRTQDVVSLSVTKPGMVIDMAHGMAVRTRDGVTQIRKPNGVKLTYHNMRHESGDLVFDGVNGVTKKWGTERTYGGRIVENIVQSVARDVMAEGMLRHGMTPVMTVHDEIVMEFVDDDAIEVRALALKTVVETAPAWATGLPIASELHMGKRYAK